MLNPADTDNLLELMESRLQRVTPRKLDLEGPRAGVLLALTAVPEDPHIILTRRCDHLSTHGGEVALPGGKQDLSDRTLEETALRETREEIGLDPDQVRVIAQLGQVVSKHGLLVTPFVGIVDSAAKLRPNPDEIHSLFTVPLRFFLADERLRTDRIRYKGREICVPGYQYRGYTIWGLTAYLLVELLNYGLGAGIPLRPRPEMSQQRTRHDIPR